MISKLIRIFILSSVLSTLAFSSNLYAEDNLSNKKHYYKKTYKHPKSVDNCNNPCASAIKTSGLMPGMVLGVTGDFGFAINENNEFTVAIINGVNTSTAINPSNNLVINSTPIIFHAEHDAAYGGEISYGYLTESGIEGNISLGYHQIKNTDKEITTHAVESDIFTAMVNGAYYADFGKVYPYITVGAGISRTNARGNFVDDVTAAPVIPTPFNTNQAIFGGPIYVNFSNLRAIKLAYQAGIGLSTTVESVLLGVGYKFFGVASIEDADDSYSDLIVAQVSSVISKDGAGNVTSGNYPSNIENTRKNFRFGHLENNVHNISVFAKLLI